MPEPDLHRESLRVAYHQQRGLVRVLGRGSYRISPALKDFGVAALEKGADGIILDMTECIGMDSTFMGVIAGLAVRCTKENRKPGRIALIHLSPKLKRLLTTLGLGRLVDVHLRGDVPEELAALSGQGLEQSGDEAPAGPTHREAQMKTMLEAHEELVAALPENRPQFQDVIDFLRQDVQKHFPENTQPEDSR